MKINANQWYHMLPLVTTCYHLFEFNDICENGGAKVLVANIWIGVLAKIGWISNIHTGLSDSYGISWKTKSAWGMSGCLPRLFGSGPKVKHVGLQFSVQGLFGNWPRAALRSHPFWRRSNHCPNARIEIPAVLREAGSMVHEWRHSGKIIEGGL